MYLQLKHRLPRCNIPTETWKNTYPYRFLIAFAIILAAMALCFSAALLVAHITKLHPATTLISFPALTFVFGYALLLYLWEKWTDAMGTESAAGSTRRGVAHDGTNDNPAVVVDAASSATHHRLSLPYLDRIRQKGRRNVSFSVIEPLTHHL